MKKKIKLAIQQALETPVGLQEVRVTLPELLSNNITVEL
jgi:hypothetical protein